MYSQLESQLRNEGSNQPNELNEEEIEKVMKILHGDYRIYHDSINHERHLQTETIKVLINKIGVNKIQNLHYIDHPDGIPETNLKAETQRARWESGIPLERAFQHALIFAGINFLGNLLDPSKYPHSSKGIHCDIETEPVLYECVNMYKTTWLEDKIMLEKIGYFHKDDPQHNKLWCIVTSYKNWGKKVDQAINEDKIHVIVLNQKVHKHNKNRIQDELTPIVQSIHQEGITNNLLNEIYKLNNKDRNIRYIEHNKLKTLYQLLTLHDSSTQRDGCTFNSNNIGCLSAG
jgi:hypothetical protein